MSASYLELNEHTVYISETLKQCQLDYSIKLNELFETPECQSAFESVKSRIDIAIIVCQNSASQDAFSQATLKLEIFSYLFNLYFENKTFIRSPSISFDLLISLAVENQLRDFSHVNLKAFKLKYLE